MLILTGCKFHQRNSGFFFYSPKSTGDRPKIDAKYVSWWLSTDLKKAEACLFISMVSSTVDWIHQASAGRCQRQECAFWFCTWFCTFDSEMREGLCLSVQKALDQHLAPAFQIWDMAQSGGKPLSLIDFNKTAWLNSVIKLNAMQSCSALVGMCLHDYMNASNQRRRTCRINPVPAAILRAKALHRLHCPSQSSLQMINTPSCFWTSIRSVATTKERINMLRRGPLFLLNPTPILGCNLLSSL